MTSVVASGVALLLLFALPEFKMVTVAVEFVTSLLNVCMVDVVALSVMKGDRNICCSNCC